MSLDQLVRKALAMSGQTSAGPHDFDESTRTCKRCRCTTTAFLAGDATTCRPWTPDTMTALDGTCPGCGQPFAYYGNPDAQVPACNDCRLRPARAGDDFATINRRLGEIVKEEDEARCPAVVLEG